MKVNRIVVRRLYYIPTCFLSNFDANKYNMNHSTVMTL